MEEKSYVGMETCFFCGETKNTLLLDRRLKKTLPREACYNKEPCEKCKGYMKAGIMFISVRDGEDGQKNPYRTGKMVVLKSSAVKLMLTTFNPKQRVYFVEENVWEKMGLNKAMK